MLKVSENKHLFTSISPGYFVTFNNENTLCYIIIDTNHITKAPKPRRRRPTTSSPLKKNDESSSDIDTAPTVRRKTVVPANRRSETAASSDQVPAPSSNRFRVRSKPKLDSNTATDNSTDFTVSKDKKSTKDGYKVGTVG